MTIVDRRGSNAGLTGSAERWLCFGGLLLALLALPVQAEIYKCKLANGRTEISNAPCPSGSGTVTVRPDETVPEDARAQAERDVARMRGFVEQREAEQRREETADRQRQAEARQEAASQRIYQTENMDDCLHELAQQALDNARRSELEAICRAKAKAEPTLVPVPVFGGLGQPVDGCTRNILRQRLAPAEQERRLAACRGGVFAPPHVPTRPPSRPLKPCPRDDRYCVR